MPAGTARAQVPVFSVRDDNGAFNTEPSNKLEVQFAGHTTVGGISVAGNLVPWGGTLCLTPDDLVTFENTCPTCTSSEGGCVYATDCIYQRFDVSYVEINQGVPPVTVPDVSVELRKNVLYYDKIPARPQSSLPPRRSGMALTIASGVTPPARASGIFRVSLGLR